MAGHVLQVSKGFNVCIRDMCMRRTLPLQFQLEMRLLFRSSSTGIGIPLPDTSKFVIIYLEINRRGDYSHGL